MNYELDYELSCDSEMYSSNEFVLVSQFSCDVNARRVNKTCTLLANASIVIADSVCMYVCMYVCK
jgi:hypothetical protein